MARRKKNQLGSGSYRVQVYDYTDKAGKRHYKSFTAPTKTEAQEAAEIWRKNRSRLGGSMTVAKAAESYIRLKESVLSPSTVRAYKSYLRNHLSEEAEIGSTELVRVSQIMLQSFVSDLAREVSPKTCANVYGLLTATLAMYMPGQSYSVTLPAKVKPDTNVPTDEELRQLIALADDDMRIAIYLGAFAPLRRGEICALTASDVDLIRGTVSVTKSMVMDAGGEWVVKPTPKTYSSNRTVTLPAFVMEELRGRKGRVFPHTPAYITMSFQKLVKAAGITRRIRFHDTRAYAASRMLALTVPDLYGMKRGGWATPYVMKKHYQDVIDLEEQRQTKKILDYYEKNFKVK